MKFPTLTCKTSRNSLKLQSKNQITVKRFQNWKDPCNWRNELRLHQIQRKWIRGFEKRTMEQWGGCWEWRRWWWRLRRRRSEVTVGKGRKRWLKRVRWSLMRFSNEDAKNWRASCWVSVIEIAFFFLFWEKLIQQSLFKHTFENEDGDYKLWSSCDEEKFMGN